MALTRSKYDRRIHVLKQDPWVGSVRAHWTVQRNYSTIRSNYYNYTFTEYFNAALGILYWYHALNCTCIEHDFVQVKHTYTSHHITTYHHFYHFWHITVFSVVISCCIDFILWRLLRGKWFFMALGLCFSSEQPTSLGTCQEENCPSWTSKCVRDMATVCNWAISCSRFPVACCTYRAPWQFL
jgi:hypothetical protein